MQEQVRVRTIDASGVLPSSRFSKTFRIEIRDPPTCGPLRRDVPFQITASVVARSIATALPAACNERSICTDGFLPRALWRSLRPYRGASRQGNSAARRPAAYASKYSHFIPQLFFQSGLPCRSLGFDDDLRPVHSKCVGSRDRPATNLRPSSSQNLAAMASGENTTGRVGSVF